MGEYFSWVNVDKKEYIQPGDFDLGQKAGNQHLRIIFFLELYISSCNRLEGVVHCIPWR